MLVYTTNTYDLMTTTHHEQALAFLQRAHGTLIDTTEEAIMIFTNRHSDKSSHVRSRQNFHDIHGSQLPRGESMSNIRCKQLSDVIAWHRVDVACPQKNPMSMLKLIESRNPRGAAFECMQEVHRHGCHAGAEICAVRAPMLQAQPVQDHVATGFNRAQQLQQRHAQTGSAGIVDQGARGYNLGMKDRGVEGVGVVT